jgi:Di-haem oxidoreductase, putative peroxidase
MRYALAAVLVVACADRGPAAPCPAPPPTGLGLDAAREAYRRAALRQRLRYRDAIEPGATLRATATTADQARIDRGEVCAVDLYETGRLLFEHAFTVAEGAGAVHHRVQLGRRGGPETASCTSCHWRGGVAGAGGLPDNTFLRGDHDRISSADARNPPALIGAGVVQALAEEMTAELAAERATAVARARAGHAAVDLDLVAKGVELGTLHVTAAGRVDTRDVHGVDPDLVVRPFGWKGTAATINEFLAEATALHFGITSADLLATNPTARDPLELPAGATPELTAGQLTALAVYVAALELPVARPPDQADRSAWQHGRALFETVGCAACHLPRMVLQRPVVMIRSPVTGIAFPVDLSRDAEAPRLAFDPAAGGYPVALFSDLKRHDLGPGGASRHVHGGVAPRLYLSRRLWGLADSGPYFHDGGAATIEAAIARHDGEAALARDNWETLAGADRAALRIFLTSLQREPRFQIP